MEADATKCNQLQSELISCVVVIEMLIYHDINMGCDYKSS